MLFVNVSEYANECDIVCCISSAFKKKLNVWRVIRESNRTGE